MNVLILNGPNLNLLGSREPKTYGENSLQDIEQQLCTHAKKLVINPYFFQSNHEGELIEKIHQSKGNIDFIIINPAAYTHTSIALRDAFLAVDIPFVEVHLSNIYQREKFRHKSYLSDIAQGVICGFGAQGYLMALQAAHKHIKKSKLY